jgi:hypothetical protein
MTTNCTFEQTPLDQSSLAPNNSLTNINYTNQDFYSLKFRLRNLIKEQFPSDFNDFIESSLAFLLIEPQAFLFDTLSFKQDQIIQEVFIGTVTETENAFRIAESVGFKPTPPIPAVAMFAATINTVLPGDLIIPSGVAVTAVSNNNSVVYELFVADSNNNPIFNQDIIIPAGNLSNTSIVGVQGQTFIDTFLGTGLANQNFQLSNHPVIFDSVTVIVDGSTWNEVDYFTDSNPRKEYRLEFDSNYNAFIIFGNTQSGLFPTSGANIVVQYRVGGGTSSNIVSGAISTYRTFTLDGFGIAAAVNFSNYTASNFGYDGDTIDDVKSKLPRYVKMQGRIVSDTDYQTFADQFATPYNGQIGKSVAVLRNYGCAANIVDVYVLALSGTSGLQVANDSLKSALLDAINAQSMMGVSVCLRDGVVINTDVSVDLIVDKFYRNAQSNIESAVNSAINNFFALANWEYGQTLNASDLVKSLSSIQQIISFSTTFTTNDPGNSGETVVAKYYEIIRPDTISVSFSFQ